MAVVFDSSRQKISWAEKRWADLRVEIDNFLQLNPYTEVIEPDPQKPDYQVRKIKLTKPFPPAIPEITLEVANCLRSALDKAGHAIAIAVGTSDPKNTAFPFAGSLSNLLTSSIGRSKDIPKEIQSLFVGFQL